MGQTDESDPRRTLAAYSPQQLDNIIAAVRDPPTLSEIGPYHIEELIGEGGMGQVYKAEQREPIQRTVAIKVIKLGMDTRQVIARFESERQTLAMMDHPNVATVLDAGATDNGRPYFVMEYVHGEPITTFADREKLTVRQRLELFTQGCEAVQHAHQKAIIHRDLKPSNILVTLKDGKPWVKVIDFGVAKAISQGITEKSLATEAGQLLGTPEYMAPEQAQGNLLDVDTRTDVYSLGVVLYELLIGELPFDAAALRSAGYNEIQRIISEVDPPRPSTKLSALGKSGQQVAQLRQTDLAVLHQLLKRELEWIPLKAMRKVRDERYSSARELAEDIANYLSQRPLRAGPESRAYRARKFLRRNKTGVAASVAMVLLLIGGITATSWEAFRATRAEHKTRAALLEVQQQKKKVEDANVTVSDVNQFLISLLAEADPYQSKGQKVTVLEALDAAAGRVATSLNRQPLAEAAIRTVLSTTYTQLGHPDLAVPHARTAVDIRRKMLGNDSPETLASVNELGFALKKSGKFAEAEPLYVEAAEGCRRVLGENHPTTLTMISNLAVLYSDMGRNAQAIPMHRAVLDQRRRILGDEHPDTYQSLNNLGSVLRIENQLAEAEALYREALGRPRRAAGEDHPDTIKVLYNLAIVLQLQGKYADAEPMLRESLIRSRRVLGEEHLDTLVSEESVASLLHDEGRLDEAEPLYRHALEVARRTVGPDHLNALTFAHNLAALMKDQGKLDEAEAGFRDVLERRRRVLAPDHPGTFATMHHLASILARRGRLPEAESAWREVAAGRSRALGPEHPDTLSSIFGLVLVLRDERKLAEAETTCRALFDQAKRAMGETHPNTLRIESSLGAILQDQGKFAGAEPIYLSVLEARKHALGDAHPSTVGTLSEYGICLSKVGKFDDAIPRLTEARSALRAAGDRNVALVERVLSALIVSSEGLNRPAEASQWRIELATLHASTQPASQRVKR